MTAADFRIRRATLDDLPALRELWKKGSFAPLDLEKRFTELQVAETTDGKIAGAIGIKIERLHGQIHSELMVDPANEAALREAFWQRLQILGRNHGLFRLWTQSTAPFWAQLGFKIPDAKTRERMPAGFGEGEMFTLALKEETAEGLSVEKEFELFTATQKMETERLMQQAQAFKKVAYAIVMILTGVLLVAAVIRLLKTSALKR